MNINLQPNITGTNVKLVRGAIQSDLTNAVNNSRTYRDESEAFSIVSENKSIVATDSANSASSSATTASNAANTATTKANEANSSAISASASETVCIDKTIIATDKADIATAQAVIATNKASEASTDADTATTQASIATTKASEASTSASNALTSANNADISEANALTYRNEAESFASSVNPSNIVHINGTETITGDKTFSGTVSGLTSSTVGLGNVTNESKATMFTSPTFTGIVTLPSTTSIGTITSTELGYIDGVTSSIQTQLNNKANDSDVIKLTGNQTINGVKTFSTSPIVPTPTTTGNVITMDNIIQKTAVGIGYGAGSGGTVTQLTSKTTAVTLNKPTGIITMNNAALASNTWVGFAVINSNVTASDTIIVNAVSGSTVMDLYEAKTSPRAGAIIIEIRHSYPASLTDAMVINFTVIKGANS